MHVVCFTVSLCNPDWPHKPLSLGLPSAGIVVLSILDFQELYLMTRLAVKSNEPHGNDELKNLPKFAYTKKWSVNACFNALHCGLVRKGGTWPVSEGVLNGSPVCPLCQGMKSESLGRLTRRVLKATTVPLGS